MKYYSCFESRLGKITLQATDKGLCGAWFEVHTTMPDELGEYAPENPLLQTATEQLTQYLAGERTEFSLPLDATGTDFQKQVWQALTEIPYGESWSYQQLADHIGNPKAVRAVGLANGKNPVSVIVPCHRVIGKSGKLTGYAGGLERKKALLKLEGIDFTEQ